MDIIRKNTSELPSLKSAHKDNMFTVKKDEHGNMYYDLTDDVYLSKELPSMNFKNHTVRVNDDVYALSDEYFDTTNFWWVILVVNDFDDPFILKKMVGQTIKIPTKTLVSNIINSF